MIKQIFTWWNSQTFGTFFYTIFLENLLVKMNWVINIIKIKKAKRWVIYKGEINASKITTDWYSWIHNISNNIPIKVKKIFLAKTSQR